MRANAIAGARHAMLLAATLASLIASGAALPNVASAADTAAPGWEIGSHSYPTNLPPGGKGIVAVDFYDIGAAAATGPATVSDTLPEGLLGVSAAGWACSSGAPVTCTYELGEPLLGAGESREVPLTVEVKAGAGEGTFPNAVSISGGGASGAVSNSSTLTISAAPAGFGFANADAWFSDADGTLDMQAGSHPYAFTFGFSLNADGEGRPAAGEEARDVAVNAPPGLIGDQRAVPRCNRLQFDSEECPASTQVGVAPIGIALGGGALLTLTFPLYNLAPPPGSPAEFGFDLFGIHAFFDASVRSASDYGIIVHVGDIAELSVLAGEVTIWGVPADPSHDPQRCGAVEGIVKCGLASGAARLPFLTLPTSCTGPQSFSVSAESWRAPNTARSFSFLSHDSSDSPSGFTGCEHLGFAPSLTIAPDTSSADTPAGLQTEVRAPQEGLLDPEGLATSDIRNTTLTLPQGVAINPGEAAGLGACQLSEDGVGNERPPACPADSKVGRIEAESPILEDELKGNVYLLQSTPPNVQLLLAAAGDGVEVKIIAHVHLNEATGRLTTTLSELPQAPITDFKLSFSGGAQAALTTPTGCGTYATISDFAPWSGPQVPDAFPSSSFAIESGSRGAPCPAQPLPFTPSMLAGTTNDQAGAFSEFSLAITRPEDQQRISAFQFTLPPGLLGMVSNVTPCEEPQAAHGECPRSARIAYTQAQAGPGPYPLLVPEPGRTQASIYLTGPYKGVPYGLSIAVPLVVGPFNLGTIVVRGEASVNPTTAALTITTDPIPEIVDGVPADLRTITGVVDRSNFMFNPTDCSPMSITGTAVSTEGAVAQMQSRFQVGSCARLPFKPDYQVFTSGQTSRTDGASLDVRLTYPPAPAGSSQASVQANIAKVKVSLPKQLPARLTTIQHACPLHVFNAGPDDCPLPSRIGVAKASTPLLSGLLTGPAYFVSNGGAKFPELVIILQSGTGVRLDLHGETFISKEGITSATFASIPDAPLTSFELYMPEGPYSALAANGNLCRATLSMPTEFVAHDGAVISQSTPIGVTGCAKAAKAKKAKRGHKARKARLAVKVDDGPGARPGAASPELPSVTTGEASSVTQTSAQVSLSVNPNSSDTSYVVEFGVSETYGESVPLPPGDAGSGSEAVGEAVTLGGLGPGVTYHYRASASNASGVSHGEDRTFTTYAYPNPLNIPLAPPVVQTPTIAFPGDSAVTYYSATSKGKTKGKGKKPSHAKRHTGYAKRAKGKTQR